MKKNLLYFIAVIFCVYSCKQKTSTNTAIKGTPKSAKTASTDSNEYLDWDAAKINGSVGLLASKDGLYQALGKPDSVVKPDMKDICVSYFDKPFRYIYLKGSLFELYDDTIVVSTLNFNNTGLKLVVGNLTLDANTTLNSFSQQFPLAVKNQEALLINNDKTVISIRLNTSKTPTDDAWILIFDKGKLFKIDHWMPC